MKGRIIKTMAIMLALMAAAPAFSQVQVRHRSDDGRNYLHYIVEGKDTVFIDELPASKVYSRLPKQKGREWRKYYRLVHNFSKRTPMPSWHANW